MAVNFSPPLSAPPHLFQSCLPATVSFMIFSNLKRVPSPSNFPGNSFGAPRPPPTKSRARRQGDMHRGPLRSRSGQSARRRHGRRRRRFLPSLQRRHRAPHRARPEKLPLLSRVATEDLPGASRPGDCTGMNFRDALRSAACTSGSWPLGSSACCSFWG